MQHKAVVRSLLTLKIPLCFSRHWQLTLLNGEKKQNSLMGLTKRYKKKACILKSKEQKKRFTSP